MDSVEELQEAADDPRTFLEKLKGALTPEARKKVALALLKVPLKPELEKAGLAWQARTHGRTRARA